MTTPQNIRIAEANIQNLTSLWATVSSNAGSYHPGSAFDYALIPDSDWPNRIWHKGIHTPGDVENISRIIRSVPQKLTFPCWDIYGGIPKALLAQHGFIRTFEQVGMSMPLEQELPQLHRLDIRPVSDAYEARSWASLYPKAFGYRIADHILRAAPEHTDFYIAYYQHKPVGTAILHYTGSIAGIHGVGIIPEMRRNGFAGEIMNSVLNIARSKGAKTATLQASSMGKGLYVKMGFATQFIMENYQLT
ncbi:Acetyltransferase (GNAT) domain-containing protein [Sinomicrobium oceani]|uniref:Acetyltransferase (GNAT) domain-containing protein n=1 Tax=Sinomicrobium oceani TaxID=1150368 RepID=A0A1K1QBW9_9FLAO|nr:GNAT family N-acetyltransferase [Sinomicrobium oceani]SFW57147.1 Acetyltransferase (GNAT) domain-containing protein [Sinomicrobium oceani]